MQLFRVFLLLTYHLTLESGTVNLGTFAGSTPGIAGYLRFTGSGQEKRELIVGTSTVTATPTLSNGFIVEADSIVNIVNQNSSLTLSNNVTGTAALTKTGQGSLILNNATGNLASLTVNQGQFTSNANSPLIFTGNVTAESLIGITDHYAQISLNNDIVKGQITAKNHGTVQITGGSFEKGLTAQDNSSITLTGTGGATLWATGNIQIDATSSLSITGNSRVNLIGDFTSTGTLSVSNSRVELSSGTFTLNQQNPANPATFRDSTIVANAFLLTSGSVANMQDTTLGIRTVSQIEGQLNLGINPGNTHTAAVNFGSIGSAVIANGGTLSIGSTGSNSGTGTSPTYYGSTLSGSLTLADNTVANTLRLTETSFVGNIVSSGTRNVFAMTNAQVTGNVSMSGNTMSVTGTQNRIMGSLDLSLYGASSALEAGSRLQVDNGTTLSNGTLTILGELHSGLVINNSTVNLGTLANGSTPTQPGVLSGNVTLSKGNFIYNAGTFGDTLTFQGASSDINARVFTVNGATPLSMGALRMNSSGTLQLNQDLEVQGAANNTTGNPESLSGSANLLVKGTGSLILDANGTHGGEIGYSSTGTLVLNAANAIGTGGTLYMYSQTPGQNILSMEVAANQMKNLSVPIAANSLHMQVDNRDTVVDNIQWSGVVNVAGTLVKTGIDTLELSSANSSITNLDVTEGNFLSRGQNNFTFIQTRAGTQVSLDRDKFSTMNGVTAGFNTEAGSVLSLSNMAATLNGAQTLNNGTLRLLSGTNLNITGSFVSSGSLDIEDSRLAATGDILLSSLTGVNSTTLSSATVNAAGNLTLLGDINTDAQLMNGSTSLTGNQVIIGIQNYSGGGTPTQIATNIGLDQNVNLVQTHGNFQMGLIGGTAPVQMDLRGTLQVGGNLLLNGGSVLNLTLAGNTQSALGTGILNDATLNLSSDDIRRTVSTQGMTLNDNSLLQLTNVNLDVANGRGTLAFHGSTTPGIVSEMLRLNDNSIITGNTSFTGLNELAVNGNAQITGRLISSGEFDITSTTPDSLLTLTTLEASGALSVKDGVQVKTSSIILASGANALVTDSTLIVEGETKLASNADLTFTTSLASHDFGSLGVLSLSTGNTASITGASVQNKANIRGTITFPGASNDNTVDLVNTIFTGDITLAGTYTQNPDGSFTGNTLHMDNSMINGTLLVKGGIFNLDGDNSATTFGLSGTARMNINSGASFTAENTIVDNNADLSILGTQRGNLQQNGGRIVLGSLNPNVSGTIEGNLSLKGGSFIYNMGEINGNIAFTGLSASSSNIMTVNSDWGTASPIAIDMQGYGTINVVAGKSMVIDQLKGGGTLLLTGAGLSQFNGAAASGITEEYTGDIVTNGLGDIVLAGKNAIGRTGTLILNGSTLDLTVTGDQGKNLSASGNSTINLNNAANVAWDGKMTLGTLVKSGAGTLTLHSTGDSFDQLTINEGNFVSNGGNIFHHISALNGDVTLNQGDTVSGNLIVGTGDTASGHTHSATFNSMNTTLNGEVTIKEDGFLAITANSNVSLNGTFSDKGGLLIDHSTLNVNIGSVEITNAELNNARLNTDDVLTIKGNVELTAGATNTQQSTISVGALVLDTAASQLNLDKGVNTLNVETNFALSNGADALLSGRMDIGGTTSITSGATLTLDAKGSLASDMGAVTVDGAGSALTLTYGTSGSRQQLVNSSDITLSNGASLSLTNINLQFENGGKLTLNGTVDPLNKADMLSLSNSLISGDVLASLNNSLSVGAGTTTITGTLTVDGSMDITGAGTLSLGNSLVLKAGAGHTLDITDTTIATAKLSLEAGTVTTLSEGAFAISGTTTLDNATLTLDTATDGHDFGRIGTTLVKNGSIFTAVSTGTTPASIQGDIRLANNGVIPNTLNLTQINLDGSITMLGGNNTFNMTDSSVMGLLDIEGGSFNLAGDNFAQIASISGNTTMDLAAGASFTADSTLVKPLGHLDIRGALNSHLLLQGGTATLYSTGSIGSALAERTVAITDGMFSYAGGNLYGNIIMNGASEGAAQVTVQSGWSSFDYNLDMQGYGSLNLNADMVMDSARIVNGLPAGGRLTGSGELSVTGTGALTFNETGTHTGNIYYNSTGLLTLGVANAVGTTGSLNMLQANSSLNVTGNQAKNLTAAGNLQLNTNGNVTWSGTMSVFSLDKTGTGNLKLASSASRIGALTVDGGSFTSNGANAFNSINARNGDVYLSQGDTVAGNLTVGDNDNTVLSTVTLTSITTTLSGGVTINTDGTLALAANSKVTLNGNFSSTGSLDIDNSTLDVRAGNLTLANAGFNNGSLVTNGTLTITGSLGLNAAGQTANTQSTVSAANLVMSGAASRLVLDKGINSLNVSQNTQISDAAYLSLKGNVNLGNLTTIQTGGQAEIVLLGDTQSLIGDVRITGANSLFSLANSGLGQKLVISDGVTVGDAGRLTLNGINLQFENGGKLTLNGTSDPSNKADMISLTNSLISGDVLASLNNNLSVGTGTTSITGTLTVDGSMDISGAGTLSLGNSLVLTAGAGHLLNITDTTIAAKNASLGADSVTTMTNGAFAVTGTTMLDKAALTLTTATAGHDFGSVGTTSVKNGSTLTIESSAATQATLSGNITLANNSSTVNTLTLDNTALNGSVTLLGNSNIFNMEDSSISGLLDIEGGSFNLTGNNFAQIASISGNATMNLNTGASFTADSTLIKPLGHLDIRGDLNSHLLLQGGTATLYSTGSIGSALAARNVTITDGGFTYDGGTLYGNTILNGASQNDAQVIVDSNWTSYNYNLDMQGYGSLILGADMSLDSRLVNGSQVGGQLIGSGDLSVSGTGALTLMKSGTHTGNIYYNSTGLLTLSEQNAAGTGGILYMGADSTLQVTGNQAKILAATTGVLTFINAGDVIWNAQMTVADLDKQGAGTLTLTSHLSNIGTLNINDGAFISQGGNIFNNVNALNGDATFNQQDDIRGNLTVGNGATPGDIHQVTLNSMNSTLSGNVTVRQDGALALTANSNVTLNGTFTSDGSLLIDHSTLNVNMGAVELTNASLNSGHFNAAGAMTIKGNIALANGASDSQQSSISAGTLVMDTAASQLNLNKGTNTLTISSDFTISNGADAYISGSMDIGGLTSISTGATLTLDVKGTALSDIGTITLDGTGSTLTLTYATTQGHQRQVNSSGITLNNGSGLVLNNIDLQFENGGKLTLNGTNDPNNKADMISLTNSLISGDVLASLNNMLSVGAGTTTITGTLTVDGSMDISGAGTLSLGNSLVLTAGAGHLLNITDTTIATQNVSLGANSVTTMTNGTFAVSGTTTLDNAELTLTTTASGHNFGDIGTTSVENGSSLTIESSGANKATLAGDITLTDDGAISNTLTLNNTALDGSVTLLGGNNTFNMQNSSISGLLDIEGGTFNLTGNNFAQMASISGNTNMNLSAGATFTADSTLIKPQGHLDIRGALNSHLLLQGGTATLYNTGSIGSALAGRNVTVTNGDFTYGGGALYGNMILNGATQNAAQVTVQSGWTSYDYNLDMQGYGSLSLNADMVMDSSRVINGTPVGGRLTGSGELSVNGTGALTFNETGTHTGNINYNSTGLLTLGTTNAAGVSGTITMMQANSALQVTGNQGKNLASTGNVALTTMGDVNWTGVMTVASLDKSGAGNLRLEASASRIGSLTVNGGGFISNGSNAFNTIDARNGNVYLSQGDTISGNLTIGDNDMTVTSTVTFSSITTTMSGAVTVNTDGTLALAANSKVTLNGNFSSTGSLDIDNSTLDVRSGNLTLANAGFNNGSLLTNGTLTITGTLGLSLAGQASNTQSMVSAANLVMSGNNSQLILNKGVNQLNVTQDVDISNSALLNISGNLNLGGNTTLESGGQAIAVLLGDTASRIGFVSIDGTDSLLSLTNGGAGRKLVGSTGVVVGDGGRLSLSGINLQFENGGNLTLNGTTQPNAPADLVYLNNSQISGDVVANNYNSLTLGNATTEISGNLTVDGSLSFAGTGELRLGGNMILTSGAGHTITATQSTITASGLILGEDSSATFTDGRLNLSGSTRVNGADLSLVSTAIGTVHNFGSLGVVRVDKGGSLSITGADAANKALVSGDITLVADGNTNTGTLTNVNLSGYVTVSGEDNIFNMTDSSISSILTIEGGEFNVVGTNFAKIASISGENTQMILANNSSFTAESTLVKPHGILDINGVLNSYLLLEGGSANLYATGSILKDVTVSEGTFTYDGGALNGNLIMKGLTEDTATTVVDSNWTYGHDLYMQGYGSLDLNGDMSLGGMLKGTGSLSVTGTGALTLTKTGTHSGDIYYASTGTLTLGARNALGIDGSLHLTGNNITMDVTGDQSKNLLSDVTGSLAMITDHGDVNWSGRMIVDTLNKQGSGNLTLAATGSSINTLILTEGDFLSIGNNTFGSIETIGGNLTLNQGDKIRNNLSVGTGTQATLNSLVATLSGLVTNNGTLILKDNSDVSVTGDFLSNGSLSLENSRLTVKKGISLANTTLSDSTLNVTQNLTITGEVKVNTASNSQSTVSAHNMTVTNTGSLLMNVGSNSVHLADTLNVNGGLVSVSGSLVAGKAVNVIGGGSLDLVLSGETTSYLGNVLVSGQNSRITAGTEAGAAPKLLRADSVTLSDQGSMSLDNIMLSLNEGAGTLTVNGTTTPGAHSELLELNHSRISGNLALNGGNLLQINDLETITGNMSVNGDLLMQGTGTLALGGTFTLAAQGVTTIDGTSMSTQNAVLNSGSRLTVTDGTLDILGKTTATNANITLNTSTDAVHDFGSLGTAALTGGTLSVTGGSETNKALLDGNLTLSSGIVASLVNTDFTGSITASAEANIFTLDHSHVTGNVTLLGKLNAMEMISSDIDGILTIKGGTFHVKENNSVKIASISSETTIIIADNATFKAESTMVEPEGNLIISGTLDSYLRLDNGNTDLYDTGIITKDVELVKGQLNTGGGDIRGNVIMNGKSEDDAVMRLANHLQSGSTAVAWDNLHILDMQANGTILMDANCDLTVAGGQKSPLGDTLGLTGNGTLKVIDMGNSGMTFNVKGTHTGDIFYGASRLTLNQSDALGKLGTLEITANALDFNVLGSHSKTLSSSGTVNMNTTADTDWNARISMASGTLNKTGDHNLNINYANSQIGTVNVLEGSIVSKGANKFGDVTIGDGLNPEMVSMTFNQRDSIDGSLNIGSNGTANLNAVNTDVIQSISNSGTLNLNQGSHVVVTGGFNSSSTVNLNSSTLTIGGTMEITSGTVTGNNSSLTAGDLTISGGVLDMTTGTNNLNVVNNMTVQGDGSVINGSLNTGSLDINGGGSLTVNLEGSQTSDLNDVVIGGDAQGGSLTINGDDSASRKKVVSADSVTVGQAGDLELNNVNLNLGGGDHLLSITGDGSVSMTDSFINGSVHAYGDSTNLTMTDSSISGNLTVEGGHFTINGTNNVGGTALINDQAQVTVGKDATLNAGVISLQPDGSLEVEGSIGDSDISFDKDGTDGQRLVTFVGTHTITGDIIVNADGTLALSDRSEAGDTLTLSGNLTGNGDATLTLDSNAGTIIINHSNSNFGSNVDVTEGSRIQISASDALGRDGVLNMGDNSTLIVSGNSSTIFSNKKMTNSTGDSFSLVTDSSLALSGELDIRGEMVKTGQGTLSLTGHGYVEDLNMTEGKTSIRGGEYEIGQAEVGSQATVELMDSTITGGTWTTEGSMSITRSNVEGDIVINDGSVDVNYGNTMDGDITINKGTLSLNGSDIKFSPDSSLTFDGNADDQRLINVKRDLNYEGTFQVNAAGELALSGLSRFTLSGQLTGDAALSTTGRGTVVLTEANTGYSGALHVGDGITLVGESSHSFGNAASSLVIEGDRALVVTGKEGKTGTLEFDSKLDANNKKFELQTLNDTVWNGSITGNGMVNKTGKGNLIFNTNNVTPNGSEITVREGGIILNGQISNAITMSAGTQLSGHGHTSGALIANSYSGGNDARIEVGEAGMKGNISQVGASSLILGSGSRYIVDIDMGSTHADKLIADSSATLNGATVELRHDYYTQEQELKAKDGSRWTILTADNVTGTFNGKVDNDLYYHTIAIEYFQDHVDLVMYLNYRGMSLNNTVVNNVTTINNALQHIQINNPGGSMGELLEKLKNVHGTENIENALENVGGVCLTPLMQSQIARANNHMRIMRSAVDNTGSRMLMADQKTQVWVQGTADYSKIDGDGNGADLDRNAYGGTVGIEHHFDSLDILGGMAFSYDWETWTALNNKNKNNTGYLDFYVKKDMGKWHHYGLFGVSQTDISADRNVSFADYNNRAEGSTNGYSAYLNYEVAYDAMVESNSSLQWLGLVQTGYNSIDAYTESGSIGNAGLTLEKQDALMLQLGLGARYQTAFNSVFDNAPKAHLSLKALLTYDAGDIASDTEAAFIADPASAFTLTPSEQSRIGGLFGMDLVMPYNQRVSFYMGGTFEVRSDAQNATANVGVIYSF